MRFRPNSVPACPRLFRSNLVLPDNSTDWVHISACFDGIDTVRFTLDTDLTDNTIGFTETITAGSLFTTTENTGGLLIGAKRIAAGNVIQGWDGWLDEVVIHNSKVPLSGLMSVPEPTSALLATLGLCGLLVRRRR